MNKEEKEAIDKIETLIKYLKKWNKNVTIIPADIKYFEKILDVIKTYIRMIDENTEEILEQSKEIEELKKYKEGYKLLSYSLDNYTSKDKIKAKIEELDYNDIGNFERRCKQEVLQSLLEKE